MLQLKVNRKRNIISDIASFNSKMVRLKDQTHYALM